MFARLVVAPLVLAAILTLSACTAASGNKAIHDPERIAQVKKGETTKDEVLDLFGSPTMTTFGDDDKNYETWHWTYSKSETRGTTFIPVVGGVFGGADTEASSLTIVFNEKGIVQKVGAGRQEGGAGGIQDSNR